MRENEGKKEKEREGLREEEMPQDREEMPQDREKVKEKEKDRHRLAVAPGALVTPSEGGSVRFTFKSATKPITISANLVSKVQVSRGQHSSTQTSHLLAEFLHLK